MCECTPRGMIVHDRTRLIDQLILFQRIVFNGSLFCIFSFLNIMKYIFFSLLSLFSVSLWAHPHSFVDLKTKALVNDKTLTGFQMDWTLDEIASSTLIYELQASDRPDKTKSTILNEMIETAKEEHYFSYLYNQKNDLIKFTDKPEDYAFEIKNNRIIFTVKFYLEKPQQLGELPTVLMTYEPTYYMGMEYNSEKELAITDSNCQIRLIQPKVDNSLKQYASGLDKDQTPEDGSLGRHFAQKVSMTCK
ncbi:hypothetical protein AM305_07628 [Actinobacillus minor NM305]|uniref:Uncharacterized protein n=2 Tax=Actinobacillus minor TaxID=51047 RepID=C5S0V0_9PAST|nr:hypothetical protein AM305_07628 [Actinobacillus minor NM305]